MSKSIAGTAISYVKQMKADRPLLEPVMTRVSAPSKVSWGLHSTRYVQQQPTWSPGVAGRCPGPRAILRARQRHGLTPDLLLSSPGIQRTWASNTFFRIFPQIEEILRISLKKERMNSFASFSFTELTDLHRRKSKVARTGVARHHGGDVEDDC